MQHTRSITVLFPQEHESWKAFFTRVRKTDGTVLVIVAEREHELMRQHTVRTALVELCTTQSGRLYLACKSDRLVNEARAAGVRVIDTPRTLKELLEDDDDELSEALRHFSPHLWKLQLKSHLQRVGLLSMPRLRIIALTVVSAAVLFFVVFRLLPSAEIRVSARKESTSQTTNLFLVASGVTLDTTHVRRMPLIPVIVDVRLSLTFDDISKEFLGTPAQVPLTIVNNSTENYSFRAGTRFQNEAGMVLRTEQSVHIPPDEEVTVDTQMDYLDIYGKLVGERGNVPSGVHWIIPGLSVAQRRLVYATNNAPGTGGKTSFTTVLTRDDIDKAQEKLRHNLLVAARKEAEDARLLHNHEHPEDHWEILRPEHQELAVVTYTGFVLPLNLIGEEISSAPLEGAIRFTAFAYDAIEILDLLSDELSLHSRDNKRIIEDSLILENLDIRVIGFDDDYKWIKLTADLVGTDKYILDPLSPTGALFAKKVRETVLNLSKKDALRIIKNMPEVEEVSISLWPPWNTTLPSIPAHITITTR